MSLKTLLAVFIFFLGIQTIYSQCSFRTIGHRGGSSYYFPENTLVSIEQGYIEGAWAIEIDIRMTKDSILMLMHDAYVERTTNGKGFIAEMTREQIKTFDAGSWKNPRFAGTKVPDLEGAIKVAQKYNRKLYLNMKVYQPELIKKTLIASGADEDIIIIDPDNLTKVDKYHSLMPNTPLVYFGAPPTVIDDTEFYTNLKNKNVIAVELPVIDIQDTSITWPAEYRDNLHVNGIDLWIYTINGNALFKLADDFGIDGIETDRPAMAANYFCNNKNGGFYPEKRITGQWDFIDQNLNGTIGSQMVQTGDTSTNGQTIRFGTTADFNIPAFNDTVASVMFVPGFDPAHSLQFFSNIAPHDNVLWKYPDCNLNYSLVMDILKPSGASGYIALFQTGSSNADDAELFINTNANNGIGILEQYFGSINDSTWYRLAFVFELDKELVNVYADGQLLGKITIPEIYKYRFCINNNWAVQISNLFSDENNETSPLYVNCVQIRNYSMTGTEVAKLGKATSQNISSQIEINPSECLQAIPHLIDTTVREGASLEFSAEAGDSLNYRWQLNNHDGMGWIDFTGTMFSNSASSEFSIFPVPISLNGAGIRCKISNNCVVYTNEALLHITEIPVNNSSKIQNSELVLFPNPNNGTFSIKGPSQITSLKVYSLMGEMIKSLSPENSNNIKVELPNGVYFVAIDFEGRSEVKKIIITR